jgi:signal transduction histidine kinase
MKGFLNDGTQDHLLTEAVTVVGRDGQTCTMVFSDELLSRRHASVIRVSDSEYVLLDMNSSNGVTVNGSRITRQRALRDGDRIELGGLALTFYLRGEPTASPPGLPSGNNGMKTAPMRNQSPNVRDSSEFARVLRHKTIAMDVVQVKKSMRTDFDKLLILYQVMQLVSEETDLDRLLTKVAEFALDVLDADRVSIMFRSPDGGLVPRLQKARDRENVESGLLNISQSISEYCLQRGEAIITNDALMDDRFKSGSIMMYNIRSAMCSPLSHRERHFGVLYVDNRIQGEVFGDDDLKLLEAFADSVAVAIVNSQLIQELRKSLAQQAQQQEALVQSEKLAAMGQLSAGISHEIRNPLTAISGYVQFFFMKFPPGAPFYDKMQKVEDALDQINGIVEGLLDLARRGEGRMEICHVQTILEQTLKVAEISLRRSGKVEVVRNFAEGVPELLGDRRQLQQVFLNMMVNASQAMQEGGVLTVSTRAGPLDAAGGATVEVLFQDSGCGIPPEVQSTIFQPFVTRGKKGGTGLGLSISKNIIDLHEGEILLQSRLGEGTTFLIRLPVDLEAARTFKKKAAEAGGGVAAERPSNDFGNESRPDLEMASLLGSQGRDGGA